MMTIFDYCLIIFWLLILAWMFWSVVNLVNSKDFYFKVIVLKQSFSLEIPAIFHLIWIIPLVIAYRVYG